MRRRLVWALGLALVLAACGGGSGSEDGGDNGGDDGAGTPTTAEAGDFDPDAVAIFVGQGSALSRVEPDNDVTEDLLDGLSECYETWFIDDSVWVSCTDGRLLRVDPQSGEIELDIATGDYVEELAVGEGAIWVLNGSVGISTEINEVDPATGEVVATITPDDGAYFEDIAVGEGAVWAVGGSVESLSTIARIDPATATVSDLIDTGIGPARVEAGDGLIWAVGGGFLNADGSGDLGLHLVCLDPGSNAVVSNLTVGETDGYPDLALAYGSAWLTDTAAGELVRVDGTCTEIEGRVAIGTGGQDLYEIDVAKGLVWAGNPFDSQIFGVDPTTNEFATGLNGGAKGIAFAP
jgi:hypothetical protein